ncbi:tetratricopeptide repeat protein [Sphingobium sp. CFD-1]|uniref:Uncharacterized protein n=2 Tax=Sphingobium baderi TaxID=1332080 RepID=A0A0S3EYB7_9SPHN|nr:tetratricopeptide repeat protein [Sphingobium sp. CFD-1]ALR20424.1 hypothetical protein ATN00_08970 [Sphingobium baderi]
MSIYGRARSIGFGILLLVGLPLSAEAQTPYIPDVTEAREQEWRSLTASAQRAYEAGGSAEGVEQARKALSIAEELFGGDDPRTLISENDLALHLDALHHDAEAERLFRQIFEAYLRTRGEDDQNTQLALENIIDFYISRERIDIARSTAEYALDSFRRTTGKNSDRSKRMERIVERLTQIPAAKD